MQRAILTPEQLEELHQSGNPRRETMLPKLHLAFGIISLVFLAVYGFFVIPSLFRLYEDMGASVPFTSLLVFGVFTAFPVLFFAYAFFLRKALKKNGVLSDRQKVVGLLMLIIGGFLFFSVGIAFLMLQAILPIYNATSKF